MNLHEIAEPDVLVQMVNGFRTSRIILTADELGIFDLLQGEGIPSSDAAGKLHTDPRATDRLLNGLVALGLVVKQQNLFKNTLFSNKFLVKDSAGYLGGLALSNQTWKTWSTLTDAVRKGTTVAMESTINERPAPWQESFIAAMHARAFQQAAEVADLLDLTQVRKLLDVGGGSGAFSFAMIRKNMAIRASIFDLPNIIPLTKRYTESSGFAGHVDTVEGDYLQDDLGSGFDLVFMSAIIHINSPEENRLLIRKGADALNRGGLLVIMDHIMNDDRTEPAIGAFFALNMLVGTLHGDTYTEKEITAWMVGAGLTDIGVMTTPSGNQMVTGRKQGS